MTKKLFFIAILAAFICFGCGNDSCTTTHSYGTNSFTKDAADTCVKKLAGATCYKNSSKEDVAKIIAKLQGYKFVFHKDECRDLNEKDEYGNYKTVKCPDFIPDSFKMTKVAGCEIYTVDPHTDCDTGCPKIFFKTDNNYFKTMAYVNGESANIDYMELFSQSVDGNTHFKNEPDHETVRRTSFYWSEKAEDGTEIEKGIIIYMEIVDPDAVEDEPAPDEDSDNITDEDEEIEVIDE